MATLRLLSGVVGAGVGVGGLVICKNKNSVSLPRKCDCYGQNTDLIGLGVTAFAGGGLRGCGPSSSPTTVTATGLCSEGFRSLLALRDCEPERLNMSDKRPRKSFLLDRISLATLKSESDP